VTKQRLALRRRSILVLILMAGGGAGVGVRPASGQGPTIDASLLPLPGGSGSVMGPAPGAGGGTVSSSLGAQYLGGRPGTTAPRAPTSITLPGPSEAAPGPPPIAAPAPQPSIPFPLYGTFSLSDKAEDEGPANGITLDQAIDIALRESPDLQSKFYEIPQAQADVLQAGLRANPVFYADGQLLPYGKFNRSSPGGPSQYDVNISHPLDLNGKRQARLRVTARAQRVLEAQYQDAVRQMIDSVYTAYVDVLAARQAVRYSEATTDPQRGLPKVLETTERRRTRGVDTLADVNRIKVQLDAARIGLRDAVESYRKAMRNLATILYLPREAVPSMALRGSIRDQAPPPPLLEELSRVALENRPDLLSFRLGIARAEADVRLAQASRFADVYVLAQPYTFQNNQPYGLKSPISWALGVTVPMPVYNRNQGAIARAKLNVTQTQLQLKTLERQVITDVEDALREYEFTREAVRQVRDELLPSAQQVLDDTYKLYSGGELNVVSYLNAQRDYNDTVKQYLDTAVRHRRSMLALNTAVGFRVLP
jgi:cobalt-zinc-cadmium efflux system outer membrane protein